MERTPSKQPQGSLRGVPPREPEPERPPSPPANEPTQGPLPVAAALARALHVLKATSPAPRLQITLIPGLPPARIGPEHLHQLLLPLLTLARDPSAHAPLPLRVALNAVPRALTLTLTLPAPERSEPSFIAQLALIDRLARPHGGHLQLLPQGPDLHLQLTLPALSARPLRVIERPSPPA